MKKFLYVIFFTFSTLYVSFAQCPAHAYFTYDRRCNQNRVDFDDSSYVIGTGEIISWEWNFGDGSPTFNGKNPPVHNFPSASCYNVRLIVTDSSGCKDTIIRNVCVDPLPVASFTFAPNLACSGTPIHFTFNGSGAGLTYQWNFGDGNTSSQQNPTHTYNAQGCGIATYNVRLTVTDRNGCQDDTIITVQVKQTPQAQFFEEHNWLFCHADTFNIRDTARIYLISYDPCITNFVVDWGDGSPSQTFTSGQFPIEHTYTMLGAYNVRITINGSNGCQTIFQNQITVESNPVASIIGPPVGTNTGCAPLNICITNISQNISETTTMTIDWGDGTVQGVPPSSVGQQICHTYTQSGCNNGIMNAYTITFTAQNQCDFSQTSFSPIRVYAPPQARFIATPDTACVGSPVTFINNSIPNSCASPSTTYYIWDFGDGTGMGPTGVPWILNPQQTITHTYNDTGLYVVTLTAYNNAPGPNYGCGSTVYQATVYVAQTFAEFTYDTVCFGDITHFFDQSWANGGQIISWQWNFGDGNTSNVQNPSNLYGSWGDYIASLIVTSNRGCRDTVWHVVHVDTLPYVNFAYDTVCFGDSTHFINLSHGRGANIVYYEWWFGDGDTVTNIVNPTHYYQSPGTYQVTLLAIDEKGCTDTIRHNVIVSPLPIANFIADTVCRGNPTHFHDLSTSSFGTIVTWNWNFGDGIGSSSSQNPSYIYPDSGNYLVQLIIQTNIGCRDTIIKPAYVAPYPQANFSFDTACFGYPIHFTSTTQGFGWPITSYQWNFGDGNSASGPVTSHLYNSPGSYLVQLIVSNPFGCNDTISHTVIVYAPPSAEFAFDTVCLHDSTHFFNLSSSTDNPITSFLWDFGDASSSTLTNPTHLYTNSGTYIVTLYATDAFGCRDTISHPIIVSPLPIANFSSDTSCLGNPTSFVDQTIAPFGNITSWNWNFGDGSGSSTLQNPSYIYPDSGNYLAQLIVQTNIGCRDTIIKPAYVAPYPSVSIFADTVCRGNPTHFTSITNGYGWPITSYFWDFGDGNQSNIPNPSHIYANPGIYGVQLIVTNPFGCADTAYLQAQVDSTPSPNFMFLTNCAKDTVYFFDLSTAHGTPISNWYWNFGDGNTSTDQNPTHIFANSGDFQVQLIVEATGGCSDSIQKLIHVYALPSANFAYTSACYGAATLFTDQSSANEGSIISWQWDFGDGSGSSSIQNPSYIYPDTGHYDVQLIVENSFGCKDTIQHIVPYLPRPTAQFIADTVCALTSTHFTDQSISNGSIIASYLWDFGDGFQSTQQHPEHTYSMGGTYLVTLIIESTSGCADTLYKPIHVDSIPTAQFSVIPVCFGDSSRFFDASTANSGSIISYDWNFGDSTGTSTSINPVYWYTSPGNYDVSLVVSNSKGCRDTVHQIATVYALPTAQFSHSGSCLLHPISFTDQTIPGNATLSSWTWDFGDGFGNSSQQNPSYAYSAVDTFTVTLIVQDSYGCRDTTWENIIVAPLPVANFEADSVCLGFPTSFVDLTNDFGYAITQWTWNFGNGQTSSLQNPTHGYSNSGNYSVQLIVENLSQCRDTIVKPVFVKPLPQAQFTFHNACAKDTVHFHDNSIPNATSITNWQWDLGDGNTSSIPNPTHIYSSDGTYPVQLVVTNSFGCNDTMLQNISIYKLPVANFTASVACIGFPTVFNDLSTPGSGIINSWNWDFGEAGGVSNVQNPTYTYYSGLTSYDVTLIVSDNLGCKDTVVLPISLHPQPTADFTATYACSGHPNYFTDLSVAASGSITAWNWDFGDGVGSSTLQNPPYTYPSTTSPQTYFVRLIAFDNNGCPDTIVKPVIVYPNPRADFAATTVCVNQPTSFTDQSTLSSAPIVSWEWNFGDGSGTSSQQHPQYTYPFSWNVVDYHAQLIITDSLGCKDTVSHPVRVNPLPRVNFTATTACAGQATQFNDLTHSNGGVITQWSWNFGDGIGSSTQQNPSYTYDTVHVPTMFNVTLVATDINGCMNDTTLSVLVNPNPVAAFHPISACSGYPNQFTDLSTSTGGNIVQWYWDFGDGIGNSTLQNPQYQYPNTANVTTYNVTLTVTDINGCVDNVVGTATIYPSPVANFISDSVCSGQSIQFIDQTTTLGGTVTGWYWNFGDGIGTSTQQNPQYTYNPVLQNTTFPVTLVAENSNGCKDTITKYAQIWPLPVVNFNNTTACFGNPTNFFDASYSTGSALQSWYWNFGDGIGSSNQQYPTYTYGQHGTFNVTLTVTDQHGCSNQFTKPVVVDSLPIPGFTYQLSCSQGVVFFTNTSQGNGSTIVSYLWNFGDLTWSSQINPAHYYQDTGLYLVTLHVVNNRGCRDSLKQYVHVVKGIEWDFTASHVCFGELTQFNDFAVNPDIPAVAWLWNFGDGTTSTQPDPTHLYSYPGNFNVLLTVYDAQGCSYSVQHNVPVYPQPTANFSHTVATQFNPVNFTDQSWTTQGSIISWNWDFGDGSSSTQPNPSHVYNNPGGYPVTLIVINSFGCSDTIVKWIDILPLVTAEFSFDTVCAQTPMHFTDLSTTGLGTIDYWYWNFGDGHSSNQQNPTHTYNMPGTYIVTLIVTNSSGISDTVSHQVLVLETPYADFVSSQVCIGNPTSFQDQSTGFTYPVVSWQWNLGDGNVVYGPSFSHIYSQPGTYPVELIVTNSIGCNDTVTHPVNVWENPSINLVATPKEGCKPLEVIFTDSSFVHDGTIVSWLWSFGDGTSSVSPVVAYHRYDQSGVYDVTLTVMSNHGCVATQTFVNYIFVYPYPIALFYYMPSEPTMYDPNVSFFDVSVGASSWYWDFGDNTFSTAQHPMHMYEYPGNYTVTLIAQNVYGCADTTRQKLRVTADEVIFTPNAFSPNGDGINDYFMPFGYGFPPTDFTLRIYNRWGQVIFVSHDINKPWDGRDMNSGEIVEQGVYVWKMWYRDLEGKLKHEVGKVILLP